MSMSPYLRAIRDRIGHDLLLIPVVTAVIRDSRGWVLMQQRSDNRKWGLPGGMIDPGEMPAQTLMREVHEETGLVVQPRTLIGVFGGPDARFIYPNGDQVEPTMILFSCEVLGGRLEPLDGESTDLRWFEPSSIRRLSGFGSIDFETLVSQAFQWDKSWTDPNSRRDGLRSNGFDTLPGGSVGFGAGDGGGQARRSGWDDRSVPAERDDKEGNGGDSEYPK